MAMSGVWRGAFGALLLGALSCGKDRAASRDSLAAMQSATPATSGSADACPRTGHWSSCQVKKRLDQAGVAPRDSSLGDLPTLGPTPIVFVVGTSGLAVYLFPDSTARRLAAAALDTTKFIAPSASLTMRHEATAIQNDNLLAILYSQRDQQRERVSDALMAGAPQP
jgi:hypothetical protein